MSPRGTPILAITTGVIKRMVNNRLGGLSVYQFGPKSTYCYYYAHLDSYAEGLHEGQLVQQGEIIGYVGSTGNAADSAPHLHLAITHLGPQKRYWAGVPINPYPILQQIANREPPPLPSQDLELLAFSPPPPSIDAELDQIAPDDAAVEPPAETPADPEPQLAAPQAPAAAAAAAPKPPARKSTKKRRTSRRRSR